MNNINELHSTRKKIKDLDLQIQKIESEKKRELSKEIKVIIQSMNTLGITLENLRAAGAVAHKKPKAPSKLSKKNTKKSKRSDGRTTVPIKYKNPDTGETWTGRGKAPKWVIDMEARGRSRKEFLLIPPAAIHNIQ